MRTPRKMNPKLQQFNIGRMLAGTRVNSEMVDIHALMDRKLNYRENVRNIQQNYGVTTRNYGLEQHQQRQNEQKAERVRRQDPDRLTGRWQGPGNLMIDQRFQAMRPGKRFSANGRRYYERRANRADKGRLL